MEPKEQYLSTVLKFCSYINISGLKHTHNWIHIYSHTTHINGKRKKRDKLAYEVNYDNSGHESSVVTLSLINLYSLY